MKRRAMKKSVDRRVFGRTASRVKKINTAVSEYRGGIKL